MRRSKKIIIAVVLATVLVAGSIGGVALAQENEDGSGFAAKFTALWDIAILNLIMATMRPVDHTAGK